MNFLDQLIVAIQTAIQSQNWQLLLADQAIQQLAAGVIAIAAWNLKWLALTPTQFLLRYSFSAKYRDLRSLAGDYYLYHGPLWPELGNKNPNLTQRVRVSLLRMKIGVRSNSVSQLDLVRKYGDVGYKGSLEFHKEFVYVSAAGAMDRYVGNIKYITLYRQHLASKRRRIQDILTFRKIPAMGTGTCGIMTGIANNSNIYFVPIIISRFPLSHAIASGLLDHIKASGLGITVAKEIRTRIENEAQQDFEVMAKEFDSPFG